MKAQDLRDIALEEFKKHFTVAVIRRNGITSAVAEIAVNDLSDNDPKIFYMSIIEQTKKRSKA